MPTISAYSQVTRSRSPEAKPQAMTRAIATAKTKSKASLITPPLWAPTASGSAGFPP